MAFMHLDIGACITSESPVFFIMALWIAKMLFMVFFACIVCNGQNITEYEAYWLMGVPIISH